VGGSTGGSGTNCGTATCQPPFVCNGSGVCVCSETPPQACARAGVGCGTVYDNCGQQQTCTCKAPSICEPTSGLCFTSCGSGAGGTIATSPDSPDIICPPPPAL
jgi:hypothetical protein